MNTSAPIIGLSADLFNAKGELMFGAGPLSLLSNAGLAWEVVPRIRGAWLHRLSRTTRR